MKIHAYMVAHYGIDYIPYALRSVINHVELAHVIYTPHPSHGHQTQARCPETKEQIWSSTEIGSDKIRRYELSNVFYEGPQRDNAVNICRAAGAEMILVVDCDEIWKDEVLSAALHYAWHENKARNWLINFTHLWRSFNWVCRDEGWPVRIIDLRHTQGLGYIPKEFGEIYHFGYAIRDELLRYKLQIHGHKDEMRPDWLETRWSVWPPPPDCHPTNERGFWNPEPFDKERLPELMKSHPFWNLERID